jgi:hypothetical protein
MQKERFAKLTTKYWTIGIRKPRTNVEEIIDIRGRGGSMNDTSPWQFDDDNQGCSRARVVQAAPRRVFECLCVAPALISKAVIGTSWRRMGKWIHAFLTSGLAGGKWSASRPGRFTNGERAAGTRWIEGLVGPRSGLVEAEKRKILPLPGPLSPYPVAIPTALSRLFQRP